MNMYTVTVTTTQFVEADSKDEALDIIYEALLGERDERLGNGEVNLRTAEVREGFHSTIDHK